MTGYRRNRPSGPVLRSVDKFHRCIVHLRIVATRRGHSVFSLPKFPSHTLACLHARVELFREECRSLERQRETKDLVTKRSQQQSHSIFLSRTCAYTRARRAHARTREGPVSPRREGKGTGTSERESILVTPVPATCVAGTRAGARASAQNCLTWRASTPDPACPGNADASTGNRVEEVLF